MKQANLKYLLTAAALSLLSVQANAAGVGQRIKTAIDNIAGELVLIGGGLLFIAIIIGALNLFFGTQIGKKWILGALGGGVVLVFARDITNFILSLGGGGF